MSHARQIDVQPPSDPLADLVDRIRATLPAGGVKAMADHVTKDDVMNLLIEARELIAAAPLDERLAVKTALFEARHPFYLETMRSLPAADRHLKPFDTDNSGTLERSEIQFHMEDSFDKNAHQARKFARMLFWVKMRRWSSIEISACSRKAMHASGSRNWFDDGSLDEARYEDNRRFLASHTRPFSSHALAALIERNTAAKHNPGTLWIARRLGRRVAKREYGLAWRKGGVELADGTLVISEPIYRMNADGTLMAMLFNPRQEAGTIFRWREDGELRHM